MKKFVFIFNNNKKNSDYLVDLLKTSKFDVTIVGIYRIVPLINKNSHDIMVKNIINCFYLNKIIFIFYEF